MFYIFYNNYIYTNEAYFGKIPKLLSIEKKIGNLRKKYKNTPENINSSKELIDISNDFADLFGFKEFYLSVKMEGVMNAATYPIDLCIGSGNPAKWVKVSKDGFRYSKEAGYVSVIYVNKGLIFDSDITDGEIVAIILHEIGHNFQSSLNGIVRGFSYVNQVINVILLPIIILQSIPSGQFQTPYMMFKSTRKLFVDTINSLKKNHPEMVKAYNACSNLINTMLGLIGVSLDSYAIVTMMLNPIAAIQSVVSTLIRKIANPTFASEISNIIIGVKKESLSDNFVSTYGYGAELSSGLRKMKDKDMGYIDRTIFRNMGFIGQYMDLLLLPQKVLLGMLDPHPTTEFRINDQIKYLERELQKEKLPPSIKKEIKSQISEIKKQIDLYTDSKQKGFFFTNKVAQMTLAMCGGDFRGFVAHGNGEDFDKLVDISEKE